MTVRTIEPTVMSVEEWAEANAAELNPLREKCDECNGTGEATCPCCGHEVECVTCEGAGYLYNGASLNDLYKRQRQRDLKLLKQWQEANQ